MRGSFIHVHIHRGHVRFGQRIMTDHRQELKRRGLFLEISAAHLSSTCARGDHAIVDKAREDYLYHADRFRTQLSDITGLNIIEIERLLNL